MKSNNKMGLIGILSLVVLLVAVSGCTSSGGNKTYTYGTVSFIAPDYMLNRTSSSEIVSGSDIWSTVADMWNIKGVNILLLKASNSSASPEGAILGTEAGVKQNNGIVLSTTHGTNPNGVIIFEGVAILTNPSDNSTIKYYDMSFSGNDGNTYGLQVYGKSHDVSVSDTRDMVYNSLKV